VKRSSVASGSPNPATRALTRGSARIGQGRLARVRRGRKPTSLPPAVIVTRRVSGVTASSCAGCPAADGRRMSLVVAGIGHIVQIEPERPGDQVGVVARRPAGPARAAGARGVRPGPAAKELPIAT
jgi:hypothetical protein